MILTLSLVWDIRLQTLFAASNAERPSSLSHTEYANSSIFVQTSRFEGFSLALLEAVRHGLPCVSYDYPYGPRDLIDNGKNGYIVADGKITLFADRRCHLIEHPELRKQYGAAGTKKVQLYHTDAIMKQWQSLFESLKASRSLEVNF